MSLFVDVSIQAASIVEAAWARAVANRERLSRRMDIQAVREEAARDRRRNIPWEQLYTTPTPSLYKPDEPVAHPFSKETYPVAAGFGGYRTTWPSINTGIRLWSRDGSGYAEQDIDELPPLEGSVGDLAFIASRGRNPDIVLLPINGDSFIYCYYSRFWYGRVSPDFNYPLLLPSAENAATTEAFCFLVSASTVRQLAMPDALADRFAIANPEPVWTPQGLGDGFYTGGSFAFAFNQIKIQSDAFLRFIPGVGFSAGVYQVISGVEGEPPAVRLDSCRLEDTCTVSQFGFDLTRDLTSDAPVFRKNRLADVIYPEGFNASSVIYAWDWAKPSYCRQQLLALGFSEADLAP